jgi:hypothetical protein
MVRQPLYQRVERLIRSRRAYIAGIWGLAAGLAVLAALMVWQGVSHGDRFEVGFAAYLTLGLAGALIARRAAERYIGRAHRTRTAVRLSGRTKWPALDLALDAYAMRTYTARPRVSYVPRAASHEEIDAELVYAATPVPGAPEQPYRGPLDALPGDAPVISFTEAMLDSFDTEQLLAVTAHLMARADILREGIARFGNGAREADSRALLLTHDHASLLRALEMCTKFDTTRPPSIGIVKFSDADLQARTTLKEDLPDWETRDRIAELRSHLMAAGLDVPEGDRPWPTPQTAKPASPIVQGALGIIALAVALGLFVGLIAIAYPEVQFLATYPEFISDHILGLIAPVLAMEVLILVLAYFGVRMLVGASQAKRRS